METTGSAQQAPTRLWLSPFWVLIAALVIGQLMLFRRHALEQIVWEVPTNCDQGHYLSLAYSAYDGFSARGLFGGLFAALKVQNPTSVLLAPTAAVSFLFFGPDRLSALLINFTAFAALQVALVATLRSMTGRWHVPLFGLGLLLTVESPRILPGGMYDFRVDCLAFCFYGLFLCAVVRSDFFRSRRWSLAAGCLAGLFVLFRLMTYSWMTIYAGTIAALLAIAWWFGKPDARQDRARRLQGALIVNVAMHALVLPFLLQRFSALWHYYVTSRIGSADQHVRTLLETGVQSLSGHLLHYPRSALFDHGGWLFLVTALAGLAVAVFLRRRGRHMENADENADAAPRWLTRSVLALGVVLPLGLMTAMVVKSPITGNLLLLPLIWGLLLMISRAFRAHATHPSSRALFAGLSVSALAMGIGATLDSAARGSLGGKLPNGMANRQEMARLYDAWTRTASRPGGTSLAVFSDAIHDYTSNATLTVMAYERHGILMATQEAASFGVMGVTHEQAIAALQKSDYALLSDGIATGSSCPFNRSMEELRPALRAWCEENMVLEHKANLHRGCVLLYRKPIAHIRGDSGGWILSEGITVEIPAADARRWRRVVLEGKYNPQRLGGVPTATAHVANQGDLPVRFTAGDNKYRMEFTLPDREASPATDAVQVRVTFDRHFVPREIGLSQDPRKLTVRTPVRVSLEEPELPDAVPPPARVIGQPAGFHRPTPD